MNFLVNKILDDGSVSYGLTGSGYVVSVSYTHLTLPTIA